MNVACHCLVKLGSQENVAGPWVVSVDEQTGRVAGIAPFDGEELPFTQWLGGTIVISTLNDMELSAENLTLQGWIELLVAKEEEDVAEGGFAWHLPACLSEALVDKPRRILE